MVTQAGGSALMVAPKGTGLAGARPVGRDQFAGFQMMTFLVLSSPGAGATFP
jgi:hypothetical protein